MRAFTSGAVGDGEPFEIEYRILRRDGVVRWVRAQGAVVLRDASGRAKEYQGVVLDVTSSRQAQEKRLEAMALYRTLVEQIPAAAYIELANQPPGEVHLAYISPQAAAIFGRSAEELVADPRHFADALHPDDRERALAADARAGATGEPFDEEFRIVRPDGSWSRVHSWATLVRDDDGTPLFWHGITIDVTAQRPAEGSEPVLVPTEGPAPAAGS
jgi:PAS domain S-box-containing protein